MHVDQIPHAAPPTAAHRVRNPELDWLRAYSVLLILGLHLGRILTPGRSPFGDMFAALDFNGCVDLFFAVSGFVIAGSLEPLWAGSSRTRPRIVVRDFFVRRFWRLWPASTLWITYCLAASWICAGLGGWPPVRHVAWQWLSALIPVYELREFRDPGVLGYYWTLSVEWQFYALFPFLLIALRSSRGRAGALTLLFLLGLCTNEISWMLRFDSIIGGIGIYALYRTGQNRFDPRRALLPRSLNPRPRFCLTLLLLTALLTLPQLPDSMLLGQLGLTLLCTLLVGMAAADRRLISDCGMPRLLTWIGLRSYSIYLCHIPVALTLWALLDRFDRAGAGSVRIQAMLICLALAMTLGLADLSYRHVELPFQWRHRISRPRHRPNPAAGMPG